MRVVAPIKYIQIVMSTFSSATFSEGINTASGCQEFTMVGLCCMGSCGLSRLTSCSKLMVESPGEISGDILLVNVDTNQIHFHK